MKDRKINKKEDINSLKEEITSLKRELNEKNKQLKNLLADCTSMYEGKYYSISNGVYTTFVYIKKIFEGFSSHYYAEGCYLKFAMSTQIDRWCYSEFSDCKYYEFEKCSSFKDVKDYINKYFKELTKAEFLNCIANCNVKYLTYLEKYEE